MAVRLPKFELGEPETVSTELAQRLLEHLLSGQVRPGDRLPSERQLAQTLGVGRAPVRDALKSLRLLGVIKVRQGDGTYFQRVPSDLLPRAVEWGLLLGEPKTLDLVEARQFIELATVQLAAERRDQKAIDELAGCLREMEAAGNDHDRYAEADIAFHLQIATAARNSVLRDVLASMQSLLRVWVRRVIEDWGDTEHSYRRHEKIFAAIAQGDPTAAAAAMAEHMDSANTRLRKTLARDTAELTGSA